MPTRPNIISRTGIGSAYADIIIGNDGDNMLDGARRWRQHVGGGGDDTYFGRSRR